MPCSSYSELKDLDKINTQNNIAAVGSVCHTSSPAPNLYMLYIGEKKFLVSNCAERS